VERLYYYIYKLYYTIYILHPVGLEPTLLPLWAVFLNQLEERCTLGF
jgi:hypothetical protein